MNFRVEKCWFLISFFLLNVLIWSLFMLGIKIKTVLKSELNGFHENVQHFDSRCPGSREIAKTSRIVLLGRRRTRKQDLSYKIVPFNPLKYY